MTIHGWLRWSLARRMLPTDTESVLEVGIGEGGVAALLVSEYDYVGVEPDPVSFARARERLPEAHLLNMRGEDYSGPRVDALIALEVLEHVPDDVAVLCLWAQNVHPGGVMVLSVPRGTGLHATDLRQGHERRYTHGSLSGVLRQAGLEPVQIVGYGFPIGNLLHVASDVVSRLRPNAASGTGSSGRWMQPPPWLDPVYRVIASPFGLLQRAFPNRGTGLVALAHRR
jgi:SAM-dependent methyltransferase